MPCYDSRDSEPYRGNHGGTETVFRESPEMEHRRHMLARMLCNACSLLEKNKLIEHAEPETKTWWELHKKEDLMRAAKEEKEREFERLATAARLKLTPEERKALGIS